VIASNHGLKPRHDKRTAKEARKVARTKINTDMRRDLTGIPFFVVDPPDARDHDDAILVERMPSGFRTMAVIADVPFYVRSGSALDEAARMRGFTHYFPDETYHMLPLELSTGVCSLKEGGTRAVVYVEQFRDLNGVPYKTDIGLGYIDAQRQMSYSQFQRFLGSDDPLAHPYRELQSSLNIRQYDREILMDSASTDHRYADAQLIVQAMMVDANKAIAEFLDESNQPYLRRTHAGHINPIAYAEIAAEFEAMGYEIPDSVYDLTPGYLNDLLGQAAVRDEKEAMQSMILLKLLQPALYTTRPLMHWGLGADAYAHSTSPIRRYADILTLRAVHDAVYDPSCGLSRQDEANLEKIAASLNHLQVVSRNVQHERMKYYAIKDLYRQERNAVRASLGTVAQDGIEIFLPAYGLRKTIAADRLPLGWRIANNGIGITDGATYIPTGARIRVTIADVQPHKAQWGISRLDAVSGHYTLEEERKKGPRRQIKARASAPAAFTPAGNA
jgi:ribonuclease R